MLFRSADNYLTIGGGSGWVSDQWLRTLGNGLVMSQADASHTGIESACAIRQVDLAAATSSPGRTSRRQTCPWRIAKFVGACLRSSRSRSDGVLFTGMQWSASTSRSSHSSWACELPSRSARRFVERDERTGSHADGYRPGVDEPEDGPRHNSLPDARDNATTAPG